MDEWWRPVGPSAPDQVIEWLLGGGARAAEMRNKNKTANKNAPTGPSLGAHRFRPPVWLRRFATAQICHLLSEPGDNGAHNYSGRAPSIHTHIDQPGAQNNTPLQSNGRAPVSA